MSIIAGDAGGPSRGSKLPSATCVRRCRTPCCTWLARSAFQ